MITREEFEELIGKLEADAKAKPRLYKVKVVLLSLLGYGYIALVLVALLICIALLIFMLFSIRSLALAGKLLVPLIVLVFYILRSLWVRIPAPEGFVLKRADAKPLFELATEFARKLKAPKPHSILLTGDFNAGVVQVPRFGLFGWPKNYLLVGMPLMQALSPEQFRGVIAHEFGHLSGKHGHFGSSVYRIRQTWDQLMTTLESQNHWGTVMFSKFLQWYVPYFNAYTFVLVRAQEYEADRSAAAIVGSRQFAEALVKIAVTGSYLDSSFWPEFYRKADYQPEPPSSPFGEMAGAFEFGVKPDDASSWLTLAIESKTGIDDTHPCLSDRLAALGETAEVRTNRTGTAAHDLLGDNESALCDELGKEWRGNVVASWRERHRYTQEGRHQLEVLEKKTQSEQLTIDEEWDRARLTEEFRDAESSLPLYQNILALDKKHAGASFAVGRLTINENHSSAIALIESAMRLEHEFVILGCQIIHHYLVSNGRKDEAEKYVKWAASQSTRYEAASKEREAISSDDLYIPHSLDREAVTKICNQLSSISEVKAAYLVCKHVEYFPDVPLYVLGIEPESPWYRPISSQAVEELTTTLARQLEMPGNFFVVLFKGKNKMFKKSFEEVTDSLIYPRSS